MIRRIKRIFMSEKDSGLIDEQANAADIQQDEANTSTEAESKSELTPLQEKEKECRELNDKFLRLYSDFENFRRRVAKEKIDMIQSAGESVIKDMLPVLDDFERAIATNEKTQDLEVMREGFNLIHHKFKKIMNDKGLREMEVANTVFDADLHEAITKIPAPSEDLKGKVVDVVEKGYSLNEKIIRYAKVVVGE